MNTKDRIHPIRASVNTEQLFDPRFISCGKCRFCLDDKNRYGEKFCNLNGMSVPTPVDVAWFCPLNFEERSEDENVTDP